MKNRSGRSRYFICQAKEWLEKAIDYSFSELYTLLNEVQIASTIISMITLSLLLGNQGRWKLRATAGNLNGAKAYKDLHGAYGYGIRNRE